MKLKWRLRVVAAERAETFARFQIQGKLKDNHGVRTSRRGGLYLRPKLEVKQAKGFTRDYQVVAWNDLAEEIADSVSDGDIVQLSGEIQLQKSTVSGKWEYLFAARRFELVEQALQNNLEAVKDAFDAYEIDDVPF
jgi:hypothetical protein